MNVCITASFMPFLPEADLTPRASTSSFSEMHFTGWNLE